MTSHNPAPITTAMLAEHLLSIQAIIFLLEQPLRFKSGLISPVYVDNRSLIYHPQAWHVLIDALSSHIASGKFQFDIIAGVETAGIPHSSVLAYRRNVPSVFVRKQTKTHGTKNRVEGGDVRDKHVLLIEDHISTGLSSLDGVAALRQAGAIVTDCLSITSYNFAEARQAFAEADVTPHTLLTFDAILDAAVRCGYFDDRKKAIVADWLADPWPWAEKNGIAATAVEN
ncbi:MAG: orotate phosphoribosyltransferase [Proteobacteria bacterium]|nr:orotate phosphoribosyltransferase [Pseudomonadota bacterium]